MLEFLAVALLDYRNQCSTFESKEPITMNKITPFLWFDTQAEEAMNFYTSIFQDGESTSVSRYGEAGPGTASKVMTVGYRLANLDFIGLNGGPQYSFTPAVSFFVGCESDEQIDALWAQLAEGGSALMALDKYPFSDKYGWLNDRFGLSWQLMLTGEPQAITPFLTFTGDQNGHAEEAITFYTSVFSEGNIGHIARYGPGMGEPDNAVVHAAFSLDGQPFIAMESGREHLFSFTEATSFMIECASQEEVDAFWASLTAGGQPGPCGWLKDKFGLSWQVTPTALGQMLQDKDPAKANRVMQAMMSMSRIDIAALERARDQEAVVASQS